MGTEKKHEKLEPGKKPQQDFKEKAETKKTTPQKQEPSAKINSAKSIDCSHS